MHKKNNQGNFLSKNKLSRCNKIFRFKRSKSGATFVEVSLIILPFFILITGIIEVGLLYWADLELENATEVASRMVYTGRQPVTRDDMRTEICGRTVILGNCQSNLRIDVRILSNFSDLQNQDVNPVENGDLKDDGSFSYQTPDGEQVVLMTVFYKWPLWRFIPGGYESNVYYIRKTHAFRTEPF